MKYLSKLSVLFVSSFSLSAFAEDISLSTAINAVTVHPGSALVTRQGQASIPSGEHRILIEGLPANIDPARLQLSIANSDILLGSMELNQIHHGDYTEDAERELQDELQTLRDSRKAIADRIETANLQLQLLVSLASNSDTSSIKPTVNGSELSALLNTVSSNSALAREAMRLANIELREMDKTIEQKQFDLNKISTQRKTQTQLIVNISTDRAVTAPFSIIYPQNNAYWDWLYEARLDTETKNLTYTRQVAVVQNTGENWNNISLTVTTADDQKENQTPELNSFYVDIEPLFVPSVAKNQARSFDIARAEPSLQNLEEIVVTGSRIVDEAQVMASQYLVDYKIPGRVSIEANSQEKVLPIDDKQFEVELVARSVPELEDFTFLEARFTYENEVPMQSGSVQMYRDGAFIGEGQSPALLPGNDVRLPFGTDERIKVTFVEEAQASKEGGTFSRSSTKQVRGKIEITNYHPTPMDIEILSRIPVSRNGRVKVEIPKDATPANENDVEGKTGVMMWKLAAQPLETHVIKHYIDISYPKDQDLIFEEDY